MVMRVLSEYVEDGVDSLPELRLAAASGADVFVTRNAAILRDREELERVFHIRILSPAETVRGWK